MLLFCFLQGKSFPFASVQLFLVKNSDHRERDIKAAAGYFFFKFQHTCKKRNNSKWCSNVTPAKVNNQNQMHALCSRFSSLSDSSLTPPSKLPSRTWIHLGMVCSPPDAWEQWWLLELPHHQGRIRNVSSGGISFCLLTVPHASSTCNTPGPRSPAE